VWHHAAAAAQSARVSTNVEVTILRRDSMKAIKIAFALVVGSMTVFTAGCGKSKLLIAAEEYQTAACACKDDKCTTEATKKYAEKTKEAAGSGAGSDGEAIGKATTAATECVTKIAMSSVKMPAMPAMPAH
jgi:hypothetical protein